MKKRIFIVLIIFIFTSCNTKSAKEKLEIENDRQVIAINHIVGIGKIIPENDIIQLSSPVNGIVDAIYKKENDTVGIGTVILELNHDLEDTKLMQLNNGINTQSAQIKVDQVSAEEFEAKVSNAKVELQRLQTLLLKGAETQQTIDDKTTNVKTLISNLKRVEANVIVSKSRLQETKAAFKTAQIERDQKRIKSPINGKILELTVLIGGSVTAQLSFAQISPQGKTIAICEID